MPETIQVRPDEQFDAVKLAAYLRDKLPLGENQDAPLAVQQFPGGAANLTYLLTFGTQEYVLRRPPLGPIAPKSHDMAREYTVLSVLYQAFPYAPRSYHFCEDPEIIGGPFQIMERRRGVVAYHDMPKEFQAIPSAARQMSQALIEALVDFHAVDYAALGLADLGKAEGFLQRQVEGWYGRWHKAKIEDSPDFEAIYQWLNTHLPPQTEATLVHNDYKLNNVMFRADDPGQMVAIFDWDMCTLGEPLNDLGSLLAYWSDPEDPPYMSGLLGMPSPDYGFLRRDDLVQAYAARSGRDVSQILFYHLLAKYRLIVIAQQIYIRYHRGQTQDARFAAFKEIIPLLIEQTRAMTGA
jgi:aminoglycoside phosphotransferase (APT) family kinase protein